MNLVKLGKNISAKRRLPGLKQEDVAFDIDISITSYAKNNAPAFGKRIQFDGFMAIYGKK